MLSLLSGSPPFPPFCQRVHAPYDPQRGVECDAGWPGRNCNEVPLNGAGTYGFGPFNSSSTDSSTCGNDWANDTFKREFVVHDSGSGSWAVTENFDDGHFVTLAAVSPGACETSSHHGSVVTADNKGNFEGFLSGSVSGGTYTPNGCKAATADCTTTSGFILAVFGPAATYSCLTSGGASSFFFDYKGHGHELIYRHWINASDDLGGNRGDIATS